MCAGQVPAELAAMPALCWVSLAGNPVCASPPPRTPAAASAVAAGALAMGAPLGAGASGDVSAATWVRAGLVGLVRAGSAPLGADTSGDVLLPHGRMQGPHAC